VVQKIALADTKPCKASLLPVEQYSPRGRLYSFFLQYSQKSVRRAAKQGLPPRPKADPSSVLRRVNHQDIPVRPISSFRAFQRHTGPLSSFTVSLLRASSPREPQHKVNNDSKQQRNSQHGRAKAIVEAALPSHADALRPPVESDERVDHCGQRDEGEQAGADLADAVAEVEQADGQAAEDDGEVEP